MTALSLEELYARYIRPLSPAERIRLIALTADDLVQTVPAPVETPKHSIMELHGLGAEIWQGIDAQEHGNQLRRSGLIDLDDNRRRTPWRDTIGFRHSTEPCF